jgi:hypothetical protein
MLRKHHPWKTITRSGHCRSSRSMRTSLSALIIVFVVVVVTVVTQTKAGARIGNVLWSCYWFFCFRSDVPRLWLFLAPGEVKLNIIDKKV